MALFFKTKPPSNHPLLVGSLLCLALLIWAWNLRALITPKPNPAQPAPLLENLPEIPSFKQTHFSLVELRRDPFQVTPLVTETPKPPPPKKAVVVAKPKPPPPPKPPAGQLMMILKRQEEFGAIFRFGRNEPEVLVVGDLHAGWEVMSITLDHVLWRHQKTGTDYVSEIP